ncbi:hypothetical protein [Streptomyces sp. NPDC056160]|uniref:hypothetical protein n=1 Tax=Streptomyces sp. NPDC056160 TaxID=3345731 RepID=UPI0035E2FB70
MSTLWRHPAALPVALIAAVSAPAPARQSSAGTDSAQRDAKNAPSAAPPAADYHPTPYDRIKDGGTYTTVGAFDDVGATIFHNPLPETVGWEK